MQNAVLRDLCFKNFIVIDSNEWEKEQKTHALQQLQCVIYLF